MLAGLGGPLGPGLSLLPADLARMLPCSSGGLASEGLPEWEVPWEDERRGARVGAGEEICIYPHFQGHGPTVLVIDRTHLGKRAHSPHSLVLSPLTALGKGSLYIVHMASSPATTE